MVAEQIAGRGIRDRLTLAAVRAVQRHRFVPSDQEEEAHEDHPLAIGHGQTISQPYVVALMTQALSLRGGEKVLEVGTGSGYQAAVLAQIAKHVYSLEIVAPLLAQAASALARCGVENVTLRAGDGYSGWPEEAPFDAIMVTAAAPRVPEPLKEQLRVGGRLVVPVGLNDEAQELLVVRRLENGGFSEENILPVRFVPMTGAIRG
jgi:protein-L-isoaspartate(D-aspartate) O-methyltransferase